MPKSITSSELSDLKKRQLEDEKDVKYIIAGLKSEGVTEANLNEMLIQSYRYENVFGGSRGNRNYIKAMETMLEEIRVANDSSRTKAEATV